MLRRLKLLSWPMGYRAGFCFSNDAEYLTLDGFKVLTKLFQNILGPGKYLSTSTFITNPNKHDPAMSFFTNEGKPSTEYQEMLHLHDLGLLDGIHALGNFDNDDYTKFPIKEMVDILGARAVFKWWSNHGSKNNKQNLGAKDLNDYQEGDIPLSSYYSLPHARSLGIKFFWLDDNLNSPNLVPRNRSRVLISRRARDGSPLLTFNRFRGLSGQPAPTLGSLSSQISSDFLTLLLQKGGGAIVYQHLGISERNRDGTLQFLQSDADIPQSAIGFLEVLKRFHELGLWIATTGDFLEFVQARESISYFKIGSCLNLVIKSQLPIRTARLTFYSPGDIELVSVSRAGSKSCLDVPFAITKCPYDKGFLIELADRYV